jgi:hypothetical protein
MDDNDNATIQTESTASKKNEFVHKTFQKIIKYLQRDENQKWFQVFILDPIINHILDRIFPYIVVLCVLFVLLTIMIAVTFGLVFTRFSQSVLSPSI